MIYITDSKGNGSPCVKVYEGKSLKWYYCEKPDDLFYSLINLLRDDKGFKIYNVYGKRILIPNDPQEFVIRDKVKEFEGLTFNPSKIPTLVKMSEEMRWRRNYVKVRLKREENAEEILRLGIKILKPIELPKLYSQLKQK